MAPSISMPFHFLVSTSSLPHLASSYGMTYLLALSFSLYLAYTLLSALYNIYLHPLSHLPGRKSWIAFPLLPRLFALHGTMDAQILQLHGRYGPIIRLTTDEVSFTTAQAWHDIYGYRVQPQLPKPFRLEKGKAPSIINANDADHSRFRKSLSHGFSERALREQEGLVQGYVNLLVETLKGVAREGWETNMVRW